MSEPLSAAISLIQPLISVGAGFGGVWLGAWLGDRREREKRRIDFIVRQLSEFYGPLVSMREEIRSRGELRVKLEQAMDRLHAEGMVKAGGRGSEALGQASESQLATLLTAIRDENRIFSEISMPLYRKMLETFRDKMWLAEPATRQYFSHFIEFVDVWERILRDALPRQVAPEIGHTERNLHPMYAHLQGTHDRLRREMTQGKSPMQPNQRKAGVLSVGLVFVGLVVTGAGAFWAAKGVVITKDVATELASTKWGMNVELRRSLIRQSRDTRNGLALVVIGSTLQIAGVILPLVRRVERK